MTQQQKSKLLEFLPAIITLVTCASMFVTVQTKVAYIEKDNEKRDLSIDIIKVEISSIRANVDLINYQINEIKRNK